MDANTATALSWLVPALITVGAGAIGAFVALRIRGDHTPGMELTIDVRQASNDNSLRIIGLRIRNVGKVAVRKKEKMALFRLVEVEPTSVSAEMPRSEWMDFTKATEVFESTVLMMPGEQIYVERLHRCDPNKIHHVGLQFWIVPIVSWLGGTLGSHRWTTTVYF